MAILGELPLKSGDVQLNGKLAYVSQQAWVFGASVRENILFGEPYDAAKYGHIVEAAALKRVGKTSTIITKQLAISL